MKIKYSLHYVQNIVDEEDLEEIYFHFSWDIWLTAIICIFYKICSEYPVTTLRLPTTMYSMCYMIKNNLIQSYLHNTLKSFTTIKWSFTVVSLKWQTFLLRNRRNVVFSFDVGVSIKNYYYCVCSSGLIKFPNRKVVENMILVFESILF